MKIDQQTVIAASMDSVWAVLMDFGSYHEWNGLIPMISGIPAADAALRLSVSPLGLNRRQVEAKVTGFMAPKYFSFEDAHRLGEWFYHEEIIFRMKEREGGVAFVAEAYVTGLSLRFRRSTVEGAFRRSLLRLVDSLKERAEARASA